ncbi:CD164 sialomucin-like 2 protein isoform X2 [Mixophyes fleayi]|uniref:CD164 sialomucin-like 2 protein isoform X2 n=1 Tax=Mixophyes fleayi TaxID=3061075 RepID=UPI003F4E0F6B
MRSYSFESIETGTEPSKLELTGEGCRQLSSCVSCTEGEPSFNFSCKWVTCETSENSSCVTSKEQIHESCIVSKNSSMCAVPENRSAEPVEMPSEESPQSNTLSPPVFHAGSFIGGGVLVILLQTIGYFVLRHLQGPERDYQTMEETPQ